MRRLLDYVLRYRLRYGLGVLCTLVTAALQMTIPFLSGVAVNTIQAGHPYRFALPAKLRLPSEAGLGAIILMLCGAGVVMGATRWLSRVLVFNSGRDVEYDLRNDLFAHLTRLGPDFYERHRIGDLMSRMVNDLTAVRMLVGICVLTFTNTPLTFALALCFMLSASPRLTLASVAPYLLMLVAMKALSRSLLLRNVKAQEGLGAIESKVQENLAGIHVLKAYALEDHAAAGFRRVSDEYNEFSLGLARLRGAVTPLIRGAAAAALATVLIYGGSLVSRHQFRIGDLVAFMGYLAGLMWPITGLGWMMTVYQRGKAAMGRLEEILEVPPASALPDEGGERLSVEGAIEWDHVWFSYFARDRSDGGPPLRYALRDVSVKVRAGSKLAIVGRTGSGKSTMVKLLTRLIEPTEGRLLLDGGDIGELPLGVLRRTIGLVPQEPTLFSDTVAHNIAFASGDTPREEIRAAARAAGLDPDIAVLPQGLDTLVGERGLALSGGQKQRVTIARLLTYDPAVVVMDDAVSNVDSDTERAILASLEQRVRGRTTVVVSHRATTVRDADEIIVLDEGAVVERGTHEQLMARRGVYAELFRRQLLEEELARY